jgi:two-component system, NarL family, nitrate/nitrite response regulator NarL
LVQLVVRFISGSVDTHTVTTFQTAPVERGAPARATTPRSAKLKPARVMNPVRVLILNHNRLLAECLRLALTADGMSVTIMLRPAARIGDPMLKGQPQVVLLYLDQVLGEHDGDAMIEDLTRRAIKVIAVSGSSDRDQIAGWLRCGAHGHVALSASLDCLVDAVRAAANGDPAVSASTASDSIERLQRFAGLSRREQFVLAQLMDGTKAADIARSTFRSQATIRTQIQAILRKLEVGTQLEAVVEAQRLGWQYDAAHGPLRRAE